MNIPTIIDNFIKHHCKEYILTGHAMKDNIPLEVGRNTQLDINNRPVQAYNMYYNESVLKEMHLNEDELQAALFHELAHIKLGHLKFSWFSFLYNSVYSTFIINIPILFTLLFLNHINGISHIIEISMTIIIFNCICFLCNLYSIRSKEKQSDLFAIRFVHKDIFTNLLSKAQIWHQKNYPKEYLFLNKYNFLSKHPTYKRRFHYVIQ